MTEAEAKLLNCAKKHRYRDELRHRKTAQGHFDDTMLHFDHPIPGTELFLEASDRGAGAEAVFAACEELALWQRLWANAYVRLKPRGKRILNALMVDWRSRPAARIANTDHKAVDRWKTFFKVHFAQCYQAWKRDFEN